MLISINRVLSLKIKEFKLEKAIEFKKIQKDWDAHIEKSIGDGFKNKSKPVRLKDGFLTVVCLNSVWANEFQFKQTILVDCINKKRANPLVSKIRFIS
ncbi:MAG: hypothetical protein UV67_C0020G0011 [Parcubacteria group bacterium GW2011_GWC1_43_12]|nr:MAG: hypothetical protein UV34_C0028G0008 [Parcubacteria group bacterium GW2011_GWB1_42_6]KKS91748.1 MAG: hypothetical protein UV67_C0020G0011 [Parcubacteria group bacterium GW2011_GWC1_43_12]